MHTTAAHCERAHIKITITLIETHMLRIQLHFSQSDTCDTHKQFKINQISAKKKNNTILIVKQMKKTKLEIRGMTDI